MKEKTNSLLARYKESSLDTKVIINIVFISLLIIFIFLVKLIANGYFIIGGHFDFANTAQFGDFIGGVIGTIFTGAGFYFLYVTLTEQRKAIKNQEEAFKTERFEARFFEMLKIYKDNVNEQSYTESHLVKKDLTTKRYVETKNEFHGRKVFKSIYYDFTILYQELSVFFNDVDEVYNFEYKTKLSNNETIQDRKIDLLEIARLDITYCIVFLGLSSQDRKALLKIFHQKYNEEFIRKLITFSALKPKEDSSYYKSWKEFNCNDRTCNLEDFIELYSKLKTNKIDSISNTGQNTIVKAIYNIDENIESIKYLKYYGGHQFRLGHYYRHLFQTVNYINKNPNLSYATKYENIKLLRAQISTFEQKLIFLNSVSTLGRVWELEKFGITSQAININDQLITKYNLLKNIPDEVLFDDIKITTYYPLVIVETNYNSTDILKRQVLEKQYK
jgi:hypothetical protein